MTTANGAGDMLRTSERLMLNRCRFQHHIAYTLHRKPKLEHPALRFGTLIHKALELTYDPHIQARNKRTRRRPRHPADIFEHLYNAEVERTTRELPDWRDDGDEWHSHLELGRAMLTGHQERWHEQDKEYIVLAVEQTFQMPILRVYLLDSRNGPVIKEAPPAHTNSPTTYVGTFDVVLYHRPSKRLLFRDYKTTTNDPTKTRHLALDEQAGSYWAYGPLWLASKAPEALRAQIRRILRKLPPSVRRTIIDADGNMRFDGIQYDFLKKALPDTRKTNKDGQSLNKDGSISKQQPTPLFHREIVLRDDYDRNAVIERIYQDAFELGQIRTGVLSLKKSPDYFHCLLCPYADECELHETGADWQAYQAGTTVTWDPYSAHAIEDDEHEH